MGHTDLETIHVAPISQCPGLSPTDILLLSKKWVGYGLYIGRKGIEYLDVEYWDNNGIEAQSWLGRRSVKAVTTRSDGQRGTCSAAQVTIASGPCAGRTGWLLWGNDAGLQIAGPLGDLTAALWVPDREHFPSGLLRKIGMVPEE